MALSLCVPAPAPTSPPSVPAHRRDRVARLAAAGAPLLAAAITWLTPLPAGAQITPRPTIVPVPPTEVEQITRLVREKDLAGALTRADAYLVKNPRDLQVRFLRGVILTDQNKTAEAVAAFEALTQDFPELPEPYNNLAVLRANQGQLELARSLL